MYYLSHTSRIRKSESVPSEIWRRKDISCKVGFLISLKLFTWYPTGTLYVKSATRANNTSFKPHSKAKLINLWKLKLKSKLYIFAWNLVLNMLLTRGKFRYLRMNIRGDCPFCYKVEENDHIFITYDLAQCLVHDWKLLPTPINTSQLDWISLAQ